MYAHVTHFLVLALITVTVVGACPVYLTVAGNSLAAKESTLSVNWDCTSPPSRIRIYGDNPYLQETPSLEEIVPKAGNSHGRIETKIKLGEIKFPNKWNQNIDEPSPDDESDSLCVNFFVLSFNQTNHVTSFNCMKINPQWMSKTKELWLFPLKQLLIPGTRCSGCHMARANIRRKHLQDLGVFRQRFSVWQQLVFGIRYLEFSVGYFRSFHEILDIKGRFWVFNNDHEITPIFPILDDIRQFVEVSKELVIVDFHSFPYGFHDNSGAHEIFKQLLLNAFGHIAVINEQSGRHPSDFTFQQLRSASKHVIILYNHNDLSVVPERNETILWPQWRHSQVKTNDNAVESLSTADKPDDGWILDIDYAGSSLEKIEDINCQITQALNGPLATKINVIPLDFAFSSDLIDISLSVNHQKALAKQNFIVIDL